MLPDRMWAKKSAHPFFHGNETIFEGPSSKRHQMGIQDRDYMKKPSPSAPRHSRSPEDRLEDFFSNFLEKHPKFFLHVGIGFGILLVIALIAS